MTSKLASGENGIDGVPIENRVYVERVRLFFGNAVGRGHLLFMNNKNDKWKLYFYFALPVILFSMVLAMGFYQFDLGSRLHLTKTSTENHVELQVRTISLTFRQIVSDLKYLSKQQGLMDFLDNPSVHHRQTLAKDYLALSQQKKIYDQIRFLDESGLERVRVNYNSGSVKIVAETDLQNKGKRYYFTDAYHLPKHAIFVSPFDLNIEKGQIEQPIKPMIRFGMPVFDRKGNKRGIVLLNYLGNEFLKRFRKTAKDLAGNVMLINRDGYPLSSDNAMSDWGFMYPERKNESLSIQNKNVWNTVLSQKAGQFEVNNQLITFNTVSPLSSELISSSGASNAYTASLEKITSVDYFWKIVSIINKSDPTLSSNNIKYTLASFTVLITFLALTGTWILTRSRLKLAHTANQLASKVNELEKTRDHLIQGEKMASLGRMVAGFAHEVNTPVGIAVGAASQIESTVTTFGQLLKQDEVEEEDLLQELHTLNESTRLILSNLSRAANLIGSFKRSSVDQTSNQTRLFSPAEVTQDVLNALKNKLKRTSISFNVTCDDKLQVKGQPGLLDQLLTNLVLNSFIHAFDNGKTTGLIDIVIELDDERLQLCYRDDGAGMSPETLEKIFEPFYTTDRISGTGLGLYLCYNIITVELKGNIDCKSQLGQGTQYDIDYQVKTVS